VFAAKVHQVLQSGAAQTEAESGESSGGKKQKLDSAPKSNLIYENEITIQVTVGCAHQCIMYSNLIAVGLRSQNF